MVIFNFFKNWYWGGDPDEKNAISGLTLRDIHNVRKSWKVIYPDAVANGFLIFSRLFDTDPETQRLFKMVATASKEELANSVQFKAHIINLMGSFNSAIDNLHRPEVVAAMMNKLGRSHRRFRVQEKHFLELKEIMVNVLTNDLRCPQPVVESWGKFVDFIYLNIFATLHQIEK